MKTKLNYLDNPLLTENTSTYQNHGLDDLGHYLTLNNTIFYPQGGGQPADQGVIAINDSLIEIHHVRMIHSQVRHYTRQPQIFEPGCVANSQINKEKRVTHTRFHSAGHLLSNIVEKMHPDWVAVKGHHFPGEAYVEFKAKHSIKNIDLSQVDKEIKQVIEENLRLESKFISGNELSKYCPNLPYSIPAEEQVRLIRIGDYPFQPCGGTHLLNLNELKIVRLIKAKIKQDRLKISYDLA
ncbi:alanine--tRNA ligase-related protein [Legionella maioricensis]|uniref:Alanine--tRNA ligase-related protein n=1 Tax=Legionella maioricensis TaxID=2896528 RepID=A0A9X2IE23_9GAMM|nr:alanine--tRNA ligase-related protein [Legionella maioricensis]MCL9685388.1 alanine--tRNA ligase-related protein [Legionella maioricensis]MCL9688653.1 alanine--tRNA ligase-related protein [Legionella maioricensis]